MFSLYYVFIVCGANLSAMLVQGKIFLLTVVKACEINELKSPLNITNILCKYPKHQIILRFMNLVKKKIS
jgi:hypothetical protein